MARAVFLSQRCTSFRTGDVGPALASSDEKMGQKMLLGIAAIVRHS